MTIIKQLSILWEGARLMFGFLKSNKLRSFLSVLGITIGIFCIILIYTLTSSLESSVKASVDKLGDKIVYVEKWPWMFGGTYQWWDYLNRPQPSLAEYKRFENESRPEIVDKLGFKFNVGNLNLKTYKQDIEGIFTMAVHGEFLQISQMELQAGRYFNQEELKRGKNGIIIGHTIYQSLLREGNVIGMNVKLNGRKMYILGVIKKQGQAMGGPEWDNAIIGTCNYFKSYVRLGKFGKNTSIVIRGMEDQPLDNVIFEVKRILRSARKLRPKDDDNFAINKLTMFSDQLESTFSSINAAGLIIGLFALIVGGFGIANIMFVSVKERTGLIGVQKALGAKRSFILWQFMLESILLCVIGAMIGMMMVVAVSFAISKGADFEMAMSLDIFLFGSTISIVLGIISGIIPALNAARMSPVEAIRHG